MGIEVASSFTRKAAVPLDDTSKVATIALRDAIPAGVRYVGMKTWVDADLKTYVLKTGVTNTDWVEDGGAAPTVNRSVNVFSGNGTQTAFILSADPGSVNNTDAYIYTVHQDHSSYSISTVSSVTTLTFSAPPLAGTDNIIVTFGSASTVLTPADASVTKLKLAPLGELTSGTCSTNWTPTSSYTDITGLFGTFMATGRLCWVGLVSDGSGATAIAGCSNSTAATFVALDIKIFDGATEIHRTTVQLLAPGAGQGIIVPVTSIHQTYTPAAGIRSIKVQGRLTSGSGTPTGFLQQAKLVAYEI